MSAAVIKVGLAVGLAGVVTVLYPSAPVAMQADPPTLEIDPVEVSPGDTVKAKGAGFQPGTVGFHLDEVVGGEELATVTVGRDGTFVTDVPIGPAGVGRHELIACRDISLNDVCRETASAQLSVISATTTTARTTTTTTQRTTTTTRPPTTTTLPPTASTTTTLPPTASPTTSVSVSTTGPSTTLVSVTSPTTTPGLGVATTATSTSTTLPTVGIATTTTTAVGGLVSREDPLGPDPTFDPTPQDLLGATTTLPPAFSAEFVDNDFDIELTHIEVTQGLQNLANDFPLVADRPTAVRVHGLSHSGPSTLSSVYLEVSRDGQVLDVLEAENNPVQFPETFIRTSNDATPYFMLDPSYLEDSLTLRALAIIGDPTLSNDLNPADNLIETTVEFHHSLSVTVHAFPLYLADDGTSGGADLMIHDASDGWIQESLAFYRLWPVAYLTFDPFNPVVGNAGSGWDMSTEDSGSEPFPALAAVHAANGYGDREMSMGMVSENADVYWGGFAQIPGSVSWSTMKSGYSAQWPWHQRAGGIIAQEIGHNAGLQHAPCDYTAGDPLPGELHGGPVDPLFPQSYSWPNCSIGPLDPEGFYGFDVLWTITASSEPSIMTNDPSSQPPYNAAPFMSYKGIGKWLEPWHGCALLDYVGVACTQTDLIPIDDDTPGQGQGLPPIGHAIPAFSCDEVGGLGDEGGDLCDFTFDQPFDPTAIEGVDHELFLFATIDPDARTAALRPGGHLDPALYDLDAMLGAARQPAGETPITPLDAPWALWDYDGPDYVLALRGADGAVLGVQTLDVGSADGDRSGDADGGGNPLLEGDHPHGPAELLIRLPAIADLAAIDVVTEDGVVASLAPGPAAPEIGSFDVAIEGGQALVTFDASDPDGDPTYAVIQYGTRGRWQVVAQPSGGSIRIDLAMLPGGAPGEFRLAVSDGIHETTALSEPVMLDNRAPFAAVLVPADGFERPAGRIVELRGSAIDLEDRDDVTTVWSSDLDGEIGSGTVVSTRDLSIGTHTVTFTAIDSAGATGSDSIVIHITGSDLSPEHIRQQVIETFASGPPDRVETTESAGDDDSSGSTTWIIAVVAALVAAAAAGLVWARRRRGRSAGGADETVATSGSDRGGTPGTPNR